MTGTPVLILATIPLMVFLGVRHALDIDHIAAIDSMVRMRTIEKPARWIGSLFSVGHMSAVCVEMVVLTYVVKSLQAQSALQLAGGILGACVLAAIGLVNIYGIRRYGRAGFGVLGLKLAEATRSTGGVRSPLLVGFVFGLGFDTASQISALTVSAVASAVQGVQVSLILTSFFALGMIPTDTLDSLVLGETLSKTTKAGGFKIMSYALSVGTIAIAFLEGGGAIIGVELVPPWSGAILAVLVISAGVFFLRSRNPAKSNTGNQIKAKS